MVLLDCGKAGGETVTTGEYREMSNSLLVSMKRRENCPNNGCEYIAEN